MGWVNRHKRNGALLALAALALQLALSFGHMHRDDLGLPPLPAADQTLIAFATAPAPAGPVDQGHQPASDEQWRFEGAVAAAGAARARGAIDG